MLKKREINDLKMAAVRPYMLMDQNHFPADTSRHCEECICNVSTKISPVVSEEMQ